MLAGCTGLMQIDFAPQNVRIDAVPSQQDAIAIYVDGRGFAAVLLKQASPVLHFKTRQVLRRLRSKTDINGKV